MTDGSTILGVISVLSPFTALVPLCVGLHITRRLRKCQRCGVNNKAFSQIIYCEECGSLPLRLGLDNQVNFYTLNTNQQKWFCRENIKRKVVSVHNTIFPLHLSDATWGNLIRLKDKSGFMRELGTLDDLATTLTEMDANLNIVDAALERMREREVNTVGGGGGGAGMVAIPHANGGVYNGGGGDARGTYGDSTAGSYIGNSLVDRLNNYARIINSPDSVISGAPVSLMQHVSPSLDNRVILFLDRPLSRLTVAVLDRNVITDSYDLRIWEADRHIADIRLASEAANWILDRCYRLRDTVAAESMGGRVTYVPTGRSLPIGDSGIPNITVTVRGLTPSKEEKPKKAGGMTVRKVKLRKE